LPNVVASYYRCSSSALSRAISNSGIGDFGIDGVASFLQDHKCTLFCIQLGLDVVAPLTFADAEDNDVDGGSVAADEHRPGDEEIPNLPIKFVVSYTRAVVSSCLSMACPTPWILVGLLASIPARRMNKVEAVARSAMSTSTPGVSHRCTNEYATIPIMMTSHEGLMLDYEQSLT
jgi:hypothetical protein